MANDAEIIIAFIFKRSGKEKLKQSEFYLPLSMELNWFSPQEAKDFVNIAVKQNILTKDDDFLSPNFDIKNIKIPLGFKPSKQIFKKIVPPKIEPEKNLIKDIVKTISQRAKTDEKTILEKIKSIEKEKNLKPEIVALIVGKEYKVDLKEYYNAVEKTFLEEI